MYVGSSIFQQWTTVKQVAPASNVLNVAMGGSITSHWVIFIERLLRKYQPHIVCYYCGSNDINEAIAPEITIQNTLKTFEAIHSWKPETDIVYHSIIKAPQKRNQWHTVETINQEIQKSFNTSPYRYFLDWNPMFFDENDGVRKELFIEDGLHLTQRAYEKMIVLTRPFITDVVDSLN